MSNGWIALHRQLFDSTLWSLPPDTTRLAIYLLLQARWAKDPKKLPDCLIKHGELVTSLADIARGCEWYENRQLRRWSRQKVMRMLSTLVGIEFCTLKSDTYGTHVSICNYAQYQQVAAANSDSSGTPMEHPWNTRVHIEQGEQGEQKEKEDSAEPEAAPALPTVLKVPVLGDKGPFEVTQDMIDEWSSAYPGIDVLAELRKCRVWNLDNPKRQKTLGGVRRHINAWLGKAQNRAPRGQQPFLGEPPDPTQ